MSLEHHSAVEKKKQDLFDETVRAKLGDSINAPSDPIDLKESNALADKEYYLPGPDEHSDYDR